MLVSLALHRGKIVEVSDLGTLIGDSNQRVASIGDCGRRVADVIEQRQDSMLAEA